jgi:hypothetical protein
MTKTSVAAAVLALASLPLVAIAGPSVSFHGQPQAPSHVNPDAVLYSQEGTDSGIGIVSQNFESTFDIYDSQAADDFKVPGGTTWVVNEVDVIGVYFNGAGLARDENVTFYKGKKHLPGAVVGSTQTVAGADNGTGSFNIMLPTKVKLKGGTGSGVQYWVSVQANMDFSVGGEWGWENQTTVVGDPAAWENPGGGFGIGCTTYTQETTCIPDGQGDHMFVIKGKVK